MKGIAGVSKIVGVVSGKGGVGKSTVCANLAVALSSKYRVGVLDADIYGPSIPSLMNLRGSVSVSPETKRMRPLENFGVRVMSMAFLLPDETSPVVWRGPMASSALSQLCFATDWGQLDVLLVDFPPGTGDVHLTLSQQVQLSGCVVVSTPNKMALVSAVKGLNMFRKVDVPVLGVVENMSVHRCSQCGHEDHVFGEGLAKKMAMEMGAPFLGEIPIATSDELVVAAQPKSLASLAYFDIADKFMETLQSIKKEGPKIIEE